MEITELENLKQKFYDDLTHGTHSSGVDFNENPEEVWLWVEEKMNELEEKMKMQMNDFAKWISENEFYTHESIFTSPITRISYTRTQLLEQYRKETNNSLK